MYTDHFGLTAEPFSLTPDPAFLYLSPSHAEALAALKVGLQGRRGLMVMTGEVGAGKTTLLYSMLDELGPGIRSAYVTNTTLPFDDMLRLALLDFGVPTPATSRLELLTALNTFLGQCAADGITAALVIDEAQNLQDETFENLRLLSNFETFSSKLLQIVLVGQPELEAKLRRPELRQVAERIAVHCHVNPLTRRESQRYLAHRLRCAGGAPHLFTNAARRLVLRKAQGIPRRINILCHTALCFAYGRGLRRVTRAQVRAAVRERDGHGLVTLRRTAPKPLRGWLRPSLGALGFASLAAAIATMLAPTAEQLERLKLWLGNAPFEASASLRNADQAAEPPAPVAPPTDATAPAVAAIGPEGRVGGDERLFVTSAQGSVDSLAIGPSGSGSPLPHGPRERMKVRVPFEGQEKPFAPQSAAEPKESTAPEASIPGEGLDGQEPRDRAVLVQPGTSLEALMRATYGTVNPQLLRLVRAANPQIVDPDHILAGDTLVFPDTAVAQNDPSVHQP